MGRQAATKKNEHCEEPGTFNRLMHPHQRRPDPKARMAHFGPGSHQPGPRGICTTAQPAMP
eukprot:3339083-Pyramimonas_sp.AAC.1